MLKHSVRQIILRELAALRREIEAYPDDASVWETPAGIANPAGTLALHLAGNLRHFIGAKLGGSGYVRDRPAEFARRDVPREEILSRVDDAMREVGDALANLPDARLTERFEIGLDSEPTVGDFLVHLASHLAYHVGQIDYHRRIVTGDASTANALDLSELHSVR